MFDPVFLDDPNLKSTFAQNESCRSSLPPQLLFWPNFKFLYQILSSNRSKSSQIGSKSCIVLPCASTVLAHTATGDRRRRRVPTRVAHPGDPRSPSAALSSRRHGNLLLPSIPSPSSRSCCAELELDDAAHRAGQTSLPRFDPSHSELRNLTPHPLRTSLSSAAPKPGRIGL